MKNINGENNVIFISLFYVTLLLQSLIPLNNVVEVLLLQNIYINRNQIKLLFQERFVMLCFAISGTVSFLMHSNDSFFSYFHICVIMPILLYLSGKLINGKIELKKIIYTISFICLIILTISIISTPLDVEIKEESWSDEHSRMFWLFFNHNVVYGGTDIIGMLIPSFFIFFFKSETLTQKIIKICTFFLLLFCIYKAETRTSLLYISAIIIYHFRKLKLNDFIISGTCILILILVLSSIVDLSSFIPDRFTLDYNKEAGLNSRDLIWASALVVIIENASGVNSPFLQVLGVKFSPHNNFLTYWILFGWITGLIITYIFVSIEIYVLTKLKNMLFLKFFLTLLFINFFIESMVLTTPFTFNFYALLTGFMLNNRSQYGKQQ